MIVQKPEAEKRLGKKLTGRKGDWFLLSSIGTRKLGGPYSSRSEAVGREKQVQYWKRQANPGNNPMRKIAEMHPEDRAIVGSAVGSVAGYLVAPPLAPLGAAAGHIAGKRLGRPKQNPLFRGKKPPKKKPPRRKRHRSLRNIALDIKKNWKELRHAGPENRSLLRIRDIVDTMQTLCHPSDIVEQGPNRGKSGNAVIGNFLATVGGHWKDKNAIRLKDELRAIGAEQYWHDEPIENPRGSAGLRPGRPGAKGRPPKAGDKIGGWEVMARRIDGQEYRLRRVVGGETWKLEVGFEKEPSKKEFFEVYKQVSEGTEEYMGLISDVTKREGGWKRVSTSGYMSADGWQSLFREAVDFANKEIRKAAVRPSKKNPRGSAGLRPGRPGAGMRFPKVGDKIGDWKIYQIDFCKPGDNCVGSGDIYLERTVYGHTWHIALGYRSARYARYLGEEAQEGYRLTRKPKGKGDGTEMIAGHTHDPKYASSSDYMTAQGWQSLMREATDASDKAIKKWVATQPPTRMLNPEKNPRPFGSRTHDWKEVLIQKDGKRVTRKQIRDYYWKNRKKIWPFLEGQTVLVVLAPKKNEFVLIRKRGSDEKYIKLTKLEGIDDENSFEYWINRRVVEFHPVLTGKKTPILWLDIDIHAKTKAKKTALRAKAKKAFPKLRKIMRQFGVAKIYAYDSGIGGYHLEGPLKAPKGVDKLRKDFTAALKAAFADDPIFTTGIAKSGQIRLDTTTMHTLGSLRAPYSFTVTGGTKKRL